MGWLSVCLIVVTCPTRCIWLVHSHTNLSLEMLLFMLPAPQAALLLLFNESEELSYAEVQERLNLQVCV